MGTINMRIIWLFGLLTLVGFSTACSSGKHPAAKSVEVFLQALVARDEARFVARTCQEFESDALLEFDSFSMVKTRLEGLDCQAVKEDGDNATVACKGKIVATYGLEDQTFELEERAYQVTKRGGEWLVCGS